MQRAGVERGVQALEEQATKETREDAHGEKKSGSAWDPSGAIGRQAAAGHDTVQMRMMHKRLTPGMEHGEETDLGAEMLRIGGDRAEGLGGRAKEDAVDRPFVLGGDGRDRVRHGEDDVEVLAVEDLGGPALDPRGARQ